jgi:hypothetical protein
MTNTIISIQTVIFQAALLGGSFLPTTLKKYPNIMSYHFGLSQQLSEETMRLIPTLLN